MVISPELVFDARKLNTFMGFMSTLLCGRLLRRIVSKQWKNLAHKAAEAPR